MKLQEVLSEYQFRNVGQFRAIAESLGYAQEYNKGILHFTRSDDELRIDLEKIRSYTKHEPEMIRLNSSMDHVCTFFDREQSSSSEYRDILKKEGIDIVNWGDLKDDEKDRFTIIDHKNKICYTGKELYEYALQNGYILDKEFKNAVEKGDFVKLSQLKEQGYHPSKEVMQSLSNTTPSNTIIAVQKIFGLKAVSNTMGDVKLAHGQQSTDRDLKRPIPNTINRMFSDL